MAWCPVGDMTGDFATKPLQGAPFRRFRDHIMGVAPMQDPGPGKVKEPKVVKTMKSNKKNNVKKKKPRKGYRQVGRPQEAMSGHRSVLGECNFQMGISQSIFGIRNPALDQ